MTVIDLVTYYLLIGVGFTMLSLSIAKSKVDGKLIKDGYAKRLPILLILLALPTLFWPVYMFNEVRSLL